MIYGILKNQFIDPFDHKLGFYLTYTRMWSELFTNKKKANLVLRQLNREVESPARYHYQLVRISHPNYNSYTLIGLNKHILSFNVKLRE